MVQFAGKWQGKTAHMSVYRFWLIKTRIWLRAVEKPKGQQQQQHMPLRQTIAEIVEMVTEELTGSLPVFLEIMSFDFIFPKILAGFGTFCQAARLPGFRRARSLHPSL